VNAEPNANLKSAFKPKTGFGTLLAAALCGLAALAPSAACAKQVRLFAGTFGAATSTPANPYPLSSGSSGPSSVAVDNATGDIYVTDQGNHRVEKFTSTGLFLLMFGKEVNKTKTQAAAPEAQRNLCTAASGDICQPGVPASTPGAFDPANTTAEAFYLFVAVDNSPGLSHGDVYVADSSDHLITKFDSSGALVSSWGDNGPLGAANGQLSGSKASGSVVGPFTKIFEGIVVDGAGDLWVAQQENGVELHEGENAQAFEFAQDSSFLTDWIAAEFASSDNERGGIALDPKNDLYLIPWKLDSAGHVIGRVTETGAFGITVDPTSDELYLATSPGLAQPTVIQRYATCKPIRDGGACTPAETFGAGHLSSVRGLAIDPSTTAKTIYVTEPDGGDVAAFSIQTVPDVATVTASGFTVSSGMLNGTVDPAGVPLTECFFEWGEASESYGHIASCEPSAAAIGAAKSPVPVHVQISGLSVGHTYHFRLVAANANDSNASIDEPSLGQDLSFGPPLLDSAYATGVSATAATLGAQVNPSGVDTHLRFEYGVQADVYEHTLPLIDLGSGAAGQAASQGLQGLQPNTTYHYRARVENLFGAVESEDRVFTTQGAALPGLPDHRAWEMVSPPDKNGIPLEPMSEFGTVIQAAADGSGLTYVARGPIDSEPPANRALANNQLLARRGASGWSTHDIATPHFVPAGLYSVSEYLLFSPDLSLGLVEPNGATPLSPETTERTPYLRQPGGEYTPLVTAANVPEGVKFGGVEQSPESFGLTGVQFVTATPDLSHLLLQSPSVLTSPSFSSGAHFSIYEWSAGALSLVSQIPVGAATACGGAGPACAPAAAKGLNSGVGNGNEQMRHAISADGRRVVFEAGRGLYLRDTVRGETIRLDAAEAGCGSCLSGGAIFQDASIDGSKVFFADSVHLTADATAGQDKPDLYMCRVGEASGHLSCALKDLTVDHSPGESAEVRVGPGGGTVLGSSPDGSTVYFVANGALVPGAVHGNCEDGRNAADQPSAAACNLYRYDTPTEATSLVAVLAARDGNDWLSGLGSDLSRLTAGLSPNGRWLVFMSQRPLTGYDNRDARTGQPAEEVFLYDALAEGGKGRLICASCNPTGARPAGVFDRGELTPLLIDRGRHWQHQTLAASIPSWTPVAEFHALYQSRYLSNSGRLFFNANDALVPQDSNGTGDVYEYEPPGVGDCTESSPSFGKASGGCVDLISSGASGEESAFLDASETGNDVFFLTGSELALADVDTALDVYDAHVCTTELPCPPSPPPAAPACEGDACQSAVQAPNDPTPGSLTFSGPGNVMGGPGSNPPPLLKKTVKCKKPKKLSHGKCVKPKKKAKKAKRATSNRGAKR
jgi:DNA-binding beta-propeller fold protein YncE